MFNFRQLPGIPISVCRGDKEWSTLLKNCEFRIREKSSLFCVPLMSKNQLGKKDHKVDIVL